MLIEWALHTIYTTLSTLSAKKKKKKKSMKMMQDKVRIIRFVHESEMCQRMSNVIRLGSRMHWGSLCRLLHGDKNLKARVIQL